MMAIAGGMSSRWVVALVAVAAACGGARTEPADPATGAAAGDASGAGEQLGDVFARVAEQRLQTGGEPTGGGAPGRVPLDVHDAPASLDLPPVPDLTIPDPYPDGSHRVLELQLKSGSFLDREVQVTGHVVWVYDCAAALRASGMSRKKVASIIKHSPEQCSRPHFMIADRPDTPPELALWVVEVPRAPRPDERKHLEPELYAQMEAAWKALPRFGVGDRVSVSGTWAMTSPKGFRHSDGLLVYKAMTNLSVGAAKQPEPTK